MGVSQTYGYLIGGTGVLILGIIVFGGPYEGPLILGNYPKGVDQVLGFLTAACRWQGFLPHRSSKPGLTEILNPLCYTSIL